MPNLTRRPILPGSTIAAVAACCGNGLWLGTIRDSLYSFIRRRISHR
jgi:hypothetical protein